jgi:hypothetical protein
VAIRIAGAVLSALMGVYWLAVMASWPGEGSRFRILLAIAMVLPIFAAATVFRGTGGRVDRALRAVALGVALFAFSGPFLLSEWIRGDDRYVWVINQGFPCSTMGGGPGLLWVTGTSWLFAFGALAFALAGGGRDRIPMLPGIVAGIVLASLTAVAMFPRPEVFASILGCL